MPERTLSQVTKEIDQIAGEVTSLEAQIAAKRDKLTTLIREQMEIQSETLGRFGMRLVLENSKDGLSVDTPKKARAPRGSKAASGEPSTADLKTWAADQNWTFNGESPSKYVKRLPDDMREELTKAYKAAQGS